MRALYFLVLIISFFAGVAHASPNRPLPPKHKIINESVPGQYVVQLKSTISLLRVDLLEARLGGKIIDQIRPDMIVVERDPMELARYGVKALRNVPDVAMAEPNFVFHALTAPNDPDYPKMWGYNNTGAPDKDGTVGVLGMDIGLEKAWSMQKGSKKVVVAVIDTGVNYKHPDLAKNIWVNEAEANGKTGVDDDANGYVDDIHGYNFHDNTGDPMDDNGHGSHCAGVIGAEPNNGIGGAGINWDVSIMAVKFLDAGGGGTLEDAIKAIDYARKNHAVIMSNSWGGRMTSDLLAKAVSDTNDAGALFVAAAGNDGVDNDAGTASDPGDIPANYPYANVVSVAAVDNRGELADFSNYGANKVHVSAPGVNVYSTFLAEGYETLSGTSMAAPHVAGVAALISAANPTWTSADIKKRLISSSRPIAGLSGRVVSGGMVNANYALSGETPPADPNNPAIWANQAAYALSTPHPYVNNFSQSYTINEPGAKRLSVHFSKFETENAYDKVEFFDAKGNSLGSMSGNQTGRYSPIVTGDTVVMKFTSDSSNALYGFDVDSVSFEK